MHLVSITEILIAVLSAIMAGAFGFKIREDTLFDAPKRRRQQTFKTDLVTAISQGIIAWDEVSLLIQHSELNRAEVREVLLAVFRDAVTGDKVDTKIRESVKELIKRADDDEPFADIPDTVAIRLDTLLTAAPEREADIRLLAAAISDVVTHAARDQRRQKILNYVGFAVGILGLVVGVAGLIVTVRPTLLGSLTGTVQVTNLAPLEPAGSSTKLPDNKEADINTTK